MTVEEELQALKEAVRKHRDMQRDDRCYLDDYVLYQALGEPIPASACQLNEPLVMLTDCQRFIRCRHDPSKPYVSPQREIDRLTDALRSIYGLLGNGGTRVEIFSLVA